MESVKRADRYSEPQPSSHRDVRSTGGKIIADREPEGNQKIDQNQSAKYPASNRRHNFFPREIVRLEDSRVKSRGSETYSARAIRPLQ